MSARTSRRLLVSIGVAHLEEAVLDLLYEVNAAGDALEPNQIHRRLGIPDADPQNYSIAWGRARDTA